MSSEKIDKKNGENMSHGEARAQIEGIRGLTMQLGGNDVESDTIDNIIQQMENREITPEEAVTRVQGVKDGKMDYH